MNDQQSHLILSILMLVILVSVVLAWLGVLPPDNSAELLLRGDTLSHGQTEAPADQPAAPAENDPDRLTLPVDQAEPAVESETALRRWPQISAIPTIRTVDLSGYAGRERKDSPLAGITVFLDPGHGGQDSGAIYPAHTQDPLYTEADINLAVSQKAKVQLEALGATVYLIRERDDWQSIFYRIAYANKVLWERFKTDLAAAGYSTGEVDHLGPLMDEIMAINSDFDSEGGRGVMRGVGARADLRLLLDLAYQYPDALYLSIHCNALEDDDPTGGLQVFYLDSAGAYREENDFALQHENIAQAAPVYQLYRDADRKRLAILIRDGILEQIPELKYTGQADIQTKNYAVLRELNLTGALIELGFLSSPRDREILLNDNANQQMAEALADAVYRYYCQP